MLSISDTYRDKLIEADLVVFVFVSILHEFLDDLSHFISRQRLIGLFEQIVQLIVADKTVAIKI